MYGAILGDIVGSTREWSAVKEETFNLFEVFSKYTDDTVMTIATADAILHNKGFAECYQQWGKKYPHETYGLNFKSWLYQKNPKPYGSFGNGSAMRVSPCGWAANSLEEALSLAEESACVTHNHIEGIKGAQSVAAAIYMARQKKSKEDIKAYIERQFEYNLDRNVAEIRKTYKFNETCQGSVPESIICFLESKNYEDSIRKAVSLGGDADTQACITGSIAEAYYGFPQELLQPTINKLDEDMLHIINEFELKYN